MRLLIPILAAILVLVAVRHALDFPAEVPPGLTHSPSEFTGSPEDDVRLRMPPPEACPTDPVGAKASAIDAAPEEPGPRTNPTPIPPGTPNSPEAAAGSAALANVEAASAPPGTCSDGHGESCFSEPIAIENLVVWPIRAHGTGRKAEAPVWSLARARSLDGGVEIRLARSGDEEAYERVRRAMEARAEGQALTGRAVVENGTDTALLVPGGTILKGGDQDRVIAFDLIVNAGSASSAKVFCIEQNRSDPMREGVFTNGLFLAIDVFASRCVLDSARRVGRQASVWIEVARQNEVFGKAPVTRTYLACLENEDVGVLADREELKQFVREEMERCMGDENVAGFAYAIDGRVWAVREFAGPETFAEFWEPWLETICLEAVTERRAHERFLELDQTSTSPEQVRLEDVLELMQSIEKAQEDYVLYHGDARVTVRQNDHGSHHTCWMRSGTEGEWSAISKDWIRAGRGEASTRVPPKYY